jgi:pimeloyl-ACP methyl ester carboxylesterase
VVVTLLLVMATPVLCVVAAYGWHARASAQERGREKVNTPAALAASFLSECGVVLAFTVSWPLGLLIRSSAPSQPQGRVVVLLPERGLNPASLWLLRHRLHRRGWHSVVCRTASWKLGTASAADKLRDVVAKLSNSADEIFLLGHGWGGLVIRRYLRSGANAVRRVITLGTPHQGSECPLLGVAYWSDLQPNSPTLQLLSNQDHCPERYDVIAIYSDFDPFLLPPSRAYYPGAFNIEIGGHGHFRMLTSRRVFDLIVENLEAPLRTPSEP